ncbi:metal-dependent hydrolase [Halosolutus halophilus]|uniref:metal-dependent hydrolase n=1 Tax=Halosolutus halophilus TaxID=1552990 RepID=UPI002235212A|nr:metal-dependent hydrolase [Halosolutus halophilus]
MPSVLVHVAFAGLLGTALLGDRFDTKAILTVMIVTATIDADTVIGIYFPGAHRALFHNVWFLLVPGALLYWDASLREESAVHARWGAYGYRVIWVTLVTLLFAHVLLDAFYNGVNLLWPLHDRFYDLSGELLLSSDRGIEQTFVEFDDGSHRITDATARGTTEDTYYSTGFNPTPGEPANGAERTFPIADTGELFVLTAAGLGTVLFRIAETYRTEKNE